MEGKTTEKELQATYGNHVTYKKCDVMNESEFQGILLQLHLYSHLSSFPLLRPCECISKRLREYLIDCAV